MMAKKPNALRYFAIIDEVDNILIDEAPHSPHHQRPAPRSRCSYTRTSPRLVPRLDPAEDYTIDDRTQAVSLTQEGIAKMEQWTSTKQSL